MHLNYFLFFNLLRIHWEPLENCIFLKLFSALFNQLFDDLSFSESFRMLVIEFSILQFKAPSSTADDHPHLGFIPRDKGGVRSEFVTFPFSSWILRAAPAAFDSVEIVRISIFFIHSYNICKYFTFCEFFTLTLANGLSQESEWQQVSSGLKDSSNNPIVLIVSIFLISYCSRIFSKLPSVQVTIAITITLMFHSFLVLWQILSICLYFRLFLFSLCGVPEWQNPLGGKFSFFLVI